jgi:exodeoxyribonuclease VII small subunit
MKKNSPKYSEALEEIHHILEEIRKPDFPVDRLQEKLQRARLLVDSCRKTLREIQDEIEKE